jgi:hypothetical protein
MTDIASHTFLIPVSHIACFRCKYAERLPSPTSIAHNKFLDRPFPRCPICRTPVFFTMFRPKKSALPQ